MMNNSIVHKLIHILFGAYFVVSYLVNTWYLEKIAAVSIFIPLVLITIGFALSSIKINTITFKSVAAVFVSMLFLIVIDLISSQNFLFSSIRIIISFTILMMSIVFFIRSVLVVQSSKGKSDLLLLGLFVLLLGIVVGQFTIDEWASHWGGIRLHGASNPNTVAQLGFLSVFWVHYTSIKKNRWSKLGVITYILGLFVVVASLSRSAIILLVCMYVIYFGFVFMAKFAIFLKERTIHRPLTNAVVALSVCLVLVFSTPSIIDFVDVAIQAESIESRISGRTLDQRRIGWEYLWSYFTSAPLTGQAGWWNASNIVEVTAAYGGVTSPHSLYVRLLSEVGVLGSIAVMSLPITTIALMFKVVLVVSVRSNNFYTASLTISFMVGLFLRQIFEDSYLVGFGEMGSSIVILGIAVGLVEYRNFKTQT